MLYKLVIHHGGDKGIAAIIHEDFVNFPHTEDAKEIVFELDSGERAANMEEHIAGKLGSKVEIECYRPECCGNCGFFAAACRRYPPPFPKVEATQWCGEFQMS